MKWRTDKNYPRKKSFLIHDSKGTLGTSTCEVCLSKTGEVVSPATFDEFEHGKDFTHWRKMIKLPKE